MRTLIDSFRHALAGIAHLPTERNMRIHLIAAADVVILGLVFKISAIEWGIIILVSAAVLCAEAFNTAIELLADRVCSDYDCEIKRVKDVSAGAVLILAIAAAIVGICIFAPKICTLL